MMNLLLKKTHFKGRFPRSRSIFSRFYCTRPSKTAVMSFGDGSHGALGLPFLGSDVYEPTRVPHLPSDICAVGCGHYHSLAVSSGGDVWAWGRNEEGQLGRGISDSRETWTQPKRVESLDQVRVRAVFASGVVSTAIGDDGSLWVWGKSKRGQLGLGRGITEAIVPSKVEALAGEEIVKVSLGWGHALALTRDGKLFGWGYSTDGRLGQIGDLESSSPQKTPAKFSWTAKNISSVLETAEKLVLEQMEKEKDMPIIWEPSLLEELHDFDVADVSCGLDHSLILCRNGTVLSGGSNTYGQLGRAHEGSRLLPVNTGFRPVSVSSGLGHSLAVCQISSPGPAVDTCGVVSWGWNVSSQLGREGQEDIPAMVEGLAGENPVSVSGGRAHSLTITSGGEVWVWGCGKNGRLGLGSSADEAEPTLVEALSGFKVLEAVSGFDHNLVLVAE